MQMKRLEEQKFYAFCRRYLQDVLPVIYTPGIGEVALHYSKLYLPSQGLLLSYPLQEQIEETLDKLSLKEIRAIVLTDGERVLGLGDLGIGGMAIAQGKLLLYTLFGHINPVHLLPVAIDVGVNNPSLLKDPSYKGWKHPRISREEYELFIDKVIGALHKKYPHLLLQWEDMGNRYARLFLERYREKICSFNDDIQGTAAVVLAAIQAVSLVTKKKLKEQKIMIVGGGSAGIGIAEIVSKFLQEEGEAFPKTSLYIIDKEGLVIEGGKTPIPEQQKPYARSLQERILWKWENKQYISLEESVETICPTILIGVCAQGGIFTEKMIKSLCQKVERPAIFPLSNPHSKSEADPEDLVHWSKGKALIATGSPFDPIEYEGRKIEITQCNNFAIFPGLALGVIASQAKTVPDSFFLQAAQVLASYSPLLRQEGSALFPPLKQLPEIAKEIAAQIFHLAVEKGLSPFTKEEREKEIKRWCDAE